MLFLRRYVVLNYGRFLDFGLLVLYATLKVTEVIVAAKFLNVPVKELH